ncbi:hypothetical protein ACFFWB_13685 [Flavobacterium procerum]|uniref:hypothetical protein n=1 Tax=Flavobacterium procerum TaxID=1455569 RepID=UPI0035E9BC16
MFKRITITSETIENNNLVVNMIPKAQELNEVIVNQVFKPISLSKNEIDKIKLNAHKSKEGLKIESFYEVKADPLSLDFILLGKLIYNSLKKKEEYPKKENPKIDFRQLITKTCSEDFFIQDLKLNPEEKELFLQFCDADPKSKTLLVNLNVLETMDFLLL